MVKFIFSHIEIIQKIEDRFKKSFLYVLIMLSYMKLCFCIALNLAFADFSSFTAALSTILSLVFA